MQTHQVKSGETLGKIAERYYQDSSKYILLAEANDISDPDMISVGQVLVIPNEEEIDREATDLMTLKPPEFPLDRTSMKLPDNQYVQQKTEKNLIILHFTAGTSARSAYNTWKSDARRVATSYIADTDGVIYETFDPDYWAYALGNTSRNERHERRSIQIEIANVGPLVRRGDWLYWWPPKDKYQTRWCHVNEQDRYIEASYRGRDYYATFPDIQFFAVCDLVSFLCDKYMIEKQIASSEKRDLSDPSYFSSFKGVASHQNFRADKYDIGPAFDWDRFVEFVG